jgi:hypothetical protein
MHRYRTATVTALARASRAFITMIDRFRVIVPYTDVGFLGRVYTPVSGFTRAYLQSSASRGTLGGVRDDYFEKGEALTCAG